MSGGPLARLLAPLRESAFRWLWASMAISYVGDRLQELAQGWLVATLTSSAVAVGAIGIVSSVPQLLMPLGGVIADQVDRRRLVVGCQFAGAAAAAVLGILVLTGRVELWHIYVWAFIAGVIWVLTRPGFKVMLTGSVPTHEVPAAAGLNSLTETSAMVVVSGAGGAVLTVIGLPFAFLFTAASYLAAGLGLRAPAVVREQARDAGQASDEARGRVSMRRLLPDLGVSLRYLSAHRTLLIPLLATLALTVATAPTFSLLAAIVHQQGGSLVQLGILTAAASVGAMAGAVYAGVVQVSLLRSRYLVLGLAGAASLALFAVLPFGYVLAAPAAIGGFVVFAEAVWNTSRVRLAAPSELQARLQALTTMTFPLGTMLGLLWGGPAIDAFGLPALAVAAGALAIVTGALSVAWPRQ